MSNAFVEITLISVSVVLGLFGLPIWVVLVMVGSSLAWWAFVHRARLRTQMQQSRLGVLGSFALAMLALTFGHIVAFGLGGAFHSLMGFT